LKIQEVGQMTVFTSGQRVQIASYLSHRRSLNQMKQKNQLRAMP
jgi:hypothetical protein